MRVLVHCKNKWKELVVQEIIMLSRCDTAMPQIDYRLIECVLRHAGCVLSPTLSIYWDDMDLFNYKESQL